MNINVYFFDERKSLKIYSRDITLTGKFVNATKAFIVQADLLSVV